MMFDRCDVCDGYGSVMVEAGEPSWAGRHHHAKYEPCSNCYEGWVSGEARWLCHWQTHRNVCSPSRLGTGHEGCGWYWPVPVDAEVS